MNNLKIVSLAGALAFSLSVAPNVAAKDKAKVEKVSATTEDGHKKKKKAKKITDRNDPNYVRCRSEPIIGSLARKKRVCKTNQEWKLASREGNRQADEFISENRPGATSGR